MNYYELLAVTKSQSPMLDGCGLKVSVEGRNPGVVGVGDDGSCACGGPRDVLAVIGVSRLGVCVPSDGGASERPGLDCESACVAPRMLSCS